MPRDDRSPRDDRDGAADSADGAAVPAAAPGDDGGRVLPLTSSSVARYKRTDETVTVLKVHREDPDAEY